MRSPYATAQVLPMQTYTRADRVVNTVGRGPESLFAARDRPVRTERADKEPGTDPAKLLVRRLISLVPRRHTQRRSGDLAGET
jgi:hypothetical protein